MSHLFLGVTGAAAAGPLLGVLTGVQIAGVARVDYRMLFPGAFQVLEAAGWLLVVGIRDQIHRVREWTMKESV
ncbi:MAG: hypothetical protein JO334_16505 [Verrucomicrobia bacterium]|nr:hypothetical protein [Verrucomicrobiota bacterium]